MVHSRVWRLCCLKGWFRYRSSVQGIRMSTYTHNQAQKYPSTTPGITVASRCADTPGSHDCQVSSACSCLFKPDYYPVSHETHCLVETRFNVCAALQDQPHTALASHISATQKGKQCRSHPSPQPSRLASPALHPMMYIIVCGCIMLCMLHSI